MRVLRAYRSNEWFVDCPECGEITELDVEQVRHHCKEPILCECGIEFLIEEEEFEED